MDMNGMSTSTSGTPANTMTGMSMPTSTSSMDMSSSTGSMMGMDAMAMTFFSSTTTPLFSMAWTPKTPGQYAGTCIFLIALAAIFRSLLAFRLNLFRFLGSAQHPRKGEASTGFEHGRRPRHRSWKAKEAVWFASMDVLLAGLGYLMMIAVMTMNVGYFLSILGGTFLGSLIFGQFLATPSVH